MSENFTGSSGRRIVEFVSHCQDRPTPAESAEIQTGTDTLTATETIAALQIDARDVAADHGRQPYGHRRRGGSGYLYILNGASVSAIGGLSITGAGREGLDSDFLGGSGGSSLTIGGTLTNNSTDGSALIIGYVRSLMPGISAASS